MNADARERVLQAQDRVEFAYALQALSMGGKFLRGAKRDQVLLMRRNGDVFDVYEFNSEHPIEVGRFELPGLSARQATFAEVNGAKGILKRRTNVYSGVATAGATAYLSRSTSLPPHGQSCFTVSTQ